MFPGPCYPPLTTDQLNRSLLFVYLYTTKDRHDPSKINYRASGPRQEKTLAQTLLLSSSLFILAHRPPLTSYTYATYVYRLSLTSYTLPLIPILTGF